jgi:hypothetical protein
MLQLPVKFQDFIVPEFSENLFYLSRLSSVSSSEIVKAIPTLLNVKQLQHEVSIAFQDAEDKVGQYLWPHVLDEVCDINVAERTSVEKEAENQPECKTHSDEGQSREEMSHACISDSILEGNTNDGHLTESILPTATDKLTKEQHESTQSVQPHALKKELDNSSSVPTYGEEARLSVSFTANEGDKSTVVRFDGNAGHRMKGSSSCTFI